MSKGSNRRPSQVSRGTFEENWDRIFNKGENLNPSDCEENSEEFYEKTTNGKPADCGSSRLRNTRS